MPNKSAQPATCHKKRRNFKVYRQKWMSQKVQKGPFGRSRGQILEDGRELFYFKSNNPPLIVFHMHIRLFIRTETKLQRQKLSVLLLKADDT